MVRALGLVKDPRWAAVKGDGNGIQIPFRFVYLMY